MRFKQSSARPGLENGASFNTSVEEVHLCSRSCLCVLYGFTWHPLMSYNGTELTYCHGPINSETQSTSSSSGVPSVGPSHGPITGAGCYQKISVTVFLGGFFPRSIMIQSNLELLPSCERQAYGEIVCICVSVNQIQVPKMTPSFLFAAEAN